MDCSLSLPLSKVSDPFLERFCSKMGKDQGNKEIDGCGRMQGFVSFKKYYSPVLVCLPGTEPHKGGFNKNKRLYVMDVRGAGALFNV